VDLLDIGRAPENGFSAPRAVTDPQKRKIAALNFFGDRRDERMLALLHRQQ
jgi:hypothetical protein